MHPLTPDPQIVALKRENDELQEGLLELGCYAARLRTKIRRLLLMLSKEKVIDHFLEDI